MCSSAKILSKQVSRHAPPTQRELSKGKQLWRGCLCLFRVLSWLVSFVAVSPLWAASGADNTLRVAIDAEPSHLNPILDPDLWAYRIAHDLLCEPLVRRRSPPVDASSDARPSTNQVLAREFEGVLAERFRVDSDGHGIEFWLREARFHDGRTLSAHDVRATLDMLRASAGPAPRTQALVADITRITVEGPSHLRIDVRHSPAFGSGGPAGPRRLLSALAEIDILPAAHFPGGRLIHQPFNRRPVCTGPFKLSEWRRGSQILLRRHAGYWGQAAAYDELRFRIAPDGAMGLSWLRQGDVDLLGRVPPRYLQDQVEPAVQRGRFHRLDLDANQVVVLLPNARTPLLSMPPLRRAIAQIVDRERERWLREVRKGLGVPQHLPLLDAGSDGSSPSREASKDPGSAAAVGTAGISRFLSTVGQAVSIGSPEALLDAAGLLPAPSPAGAAAPSTPRVRLYQGRPVRLRLLLPTGTSELADIARRLADAIAKVGLKLDVETAAMPDFLLRLRRGAFDLALLAWSWTGERTALDVEPLLAYALPAAHPALSELSSLLASLRHNPEGRALTRLVSLWQSEAPLLLLYRPRQVLLLSPQLAHASPQLALQSDFPHLRFLRK